MKHPFSFSATFKLAVPSLAALGSIAMLPSASLADTVVLKRDAVIPVVFDDALTIRNSRVGDVFTAHVASGRYLPLGTTFSGHVLRIRYPDGPRLGSMRLEFDTIYVPHARPQEINAVPIYLGRNSDGEGDVRAHTNTGQQALDVLGGAVGGYAIGSLFHRRYTGLVVGTVAGMLVASGDRAHASNIVVDRGEEMGALMYEQVAVRFGDVEQTRGRGRGSWGRPSDVVIMPASPDVVRTPPAPGARGKGAWDDSVPAPAAPAAPAPAEPPHPVQDSPTERDIHFNRDVSIRLGDNPLQFEAEFRPYYEGETVMVPVEATAKLLGLAVVAGRGNTLYVESDDASLKIEQDSSVYRLNGARGTLPTAVVRRDGYLYAPVSAFAGLTHGDLYVNGQKLTPQSP